MILDITKWIIRVVFIMIDEKDRKIIEMLLKDGKLTYSEIARRMNLTEAAIRKRIRKLEEMGVIRGYRVEIDPRFLGYNSISIIGINTEPEDILTVANELKKKDWAKSVILTTGDHMILAEVWAKDNEELGEFIEEIYNMGKVKNVRPAIVLEYIKG